jgi:predicted nucleotide-binding protein
VRFAVPYHVRITPSSDRSHDEIRLDLSERELEERVLRPYREGRPITLKGRTFPLDDIERLRIHYTDESSDELRPQVEAEQERKRRQSHVIALGGPSINWYIAAQGRDVTDDLITGPPGSLSMAADTTTEGSVEDPRAVMVVHGRDSKARDSMFEFLEALALHPLDWSELRAATQKPTPYVGEILDVGFTKAQAFVVILSPDDEAQLRSQFHQPGDPAHETQLTPQARPNVLFEAGMAMGRHPDRTILVELGTVRPFSDIGGRHTVRMSNSTADRQELANRLKDAGCPVNLVTTRWHGAGDFEPRT